MWRHLLDNVDKFVDESGITSAKITFMGNDLRLDISNAGVNIPSEKQKYVFNKFYQADELHYTKKFTILLLIITFMNSII